MTTMCWVNGSLNTGCTVVTLIDQVLRIQNVQINTKKKKVFLGSQSCCKVNGGSLLSGVGDYHFYHSQHSARPCGSLSQRWRWQMQMFGAQHWQLTLAMGVCSDPFQVLKKAETDSNSNWALLPGGQEQWHRSGSHCCYFKYRFPGFLKTFLFTATWPHHVDT